MIDLDALRARVSPHFEDWDKQTLEFETALEMQCNESAETASKSAWKAVRRIAKEARCFLSEHPAFGGQGIYLFWNPYERSWEQIVAYIGLVKAREASHRMLDYLGKQLTLLDANVSILSPPEAEGLIARRLLASMPRTNADTRDKYINEHRKSWRLSRAKRISFYPIVAMPHQIEATETILIRSLIEITGAPDALVNRSKIKSPWPPKPMVCKEGMNHAIEAIDSWRKNGLAQELADRWSSEISASRCH